MPQSQDNKRPGVTIKKIAFSRNWNRKLDNKMFSTIRRHKGGEDYYSPKTGKVFSVTIGQEVKGNSRLAFVKLCPFNEIPDYFLMLDTGMSTPDKAKEVFQKFYKDFKETDLYYILLFYRVNQWTGKSSLSNSQGN